MADYPRSGTNLEPNRAGTSTGLSTSILVQVDGRNVGAIQELRVTTTRNVERVREVGLDGFLEAVPNQPTEVNLDITRIYFDRMRLPEAFGRIFKNIQHQRIPFNVTVFDFSGDDPKNNSLAPEDVDPEVTTFHNCWFRQYSYPYTARDYIISETAAVVCEFVSNTRLSKGGLVGTANQATDVQGIEALSVTGQRRGSLDVAGIVNATRTT